jgi:hypothetical protein
MGRDGMSEIKKSPSNVEADDSRLCCAIDEVPRATGGAISRTRVYALLKSGKLKAKRAGRRTIIPADELRRCIAALPDRTLRIARTRNNNE